MHCAQRNHKEQQIILLPIVIHETNRSGFVITHYCSQIPACIENFGVGRTLHCNMVWVRHSEGKLGVDGYRKASGAGSISSLYQGRPVNVKHDARCVMGKVGEDKNPRGEF